MGYKLRQFLQQKHLQLFFNTQIMSHLSYASTICDGCSQDTFERLNVIHNRAVKQINYSQTTTTDQKTLNILPLKKTTTTRPKKKKNLLMKHPKFKTYLTS